MNTLTAIERKIDQVHNVNRTVVKVHMTYEVYADIRNEIGSLLPQNPREITELLGYRVEFHAMSLTADWWLELAPYMRHRYLLKPCGCSSHQLCVTCFP